MPSERRGSGGRRLAQTEDRAGHEQDDEITVVDELMGEAFADHDDDRQDAEHGEHRVELAPPRHDDRGECRPRDERQRDEDAHDDARDDGRGPAPDVGEAVGTVRSEVVAEEDPGVEVHDAGDADGRGRQGERRAEPGRVPEDTGDEHRGGQEQRQRQIAACGAVHRRQRAQPEGRTVPAGKARPPDLECRHRDDEDDGQRNDGANPSAAPGHKGRRQDRHDDREVLFPDRRAEGPENERRAEERR